MSTKTLIVLVVCLVLATDAMVKTHSTMKKQLRNRNKQHTKRGTDCEGGTCWNKDGGTDVCLDANTNTEVPNVEACNAPGVTGFGETGTVYCCPAGIGHLVSSAEIGLDAAVALIGSLHQGHAPTKSVIADPAASIFTDGVLVAGPVLTKLSQYDVHSTATPEQAAAVNQYRCGPTAAIAAAINKGPANFLKLVDWALVEANCPAPQTTILEPIKVSFEAKTTTFGELGQLEQVLLDCFSSANAETGHYTGIMGKQMVKLLTAAGIATFNKAAKGSITGVKHENRFANGESWGLLLEEKEHWILVGQTNAVAPEKGKPFVFDPDSYEDLSEHIFYYDHTKTPADNQLFLDYFGSVQSGWASQ